MSSGTRHTYQSGLESNEYINAVLRERGPLHALILIGAAELPSSDAADIFDMMAAIESPRSKVK